jgi:hypothetical protein
MKTVSSAIVMATLMMGFCINSAKSQSTSQDMKYTDMIGDNPNAESDIKTVSEYINTLVVAGEVDKAMSMLSSNYLGYGPGPNDSSNLEQTIAIWKQNISQTKNRKVDFVAETFNVTSGNLSGHWVSTWGTYSFTQDDKDIKFPFQYTAHVSNGKIDQDRIYYDQLYIIKALGYTVTPPAK